MRSSFVFGAALLLSGIFIGWLLPIPDPFFDPAQISASRGGLIRENSESFEYIKPLLACEIGSMDSFPELAGMRSAVNRYITGQLLRRKALNASVYYRDLNTGQWFVVNGDKKYAPASLLKVFVMMAYFKEADKTDDPARLDREIAFDKTYDANDSLPGEEFPHLVKGAHYSVGQLIEQMISYSDNEAFYTLADHFDTNTNKYFELIFKDLNIPSPVGRNEKSLYAMSVGDYSLPFRVLYGSTYLSERYSERALALLSRSHFREGIVAGVPASVKVAHKFGVINAPMQDGSITPNELHDCGVVYNKSAPYFLCIMTEGKDLRPLRETIQGVSDIVYREMTKQR